MMRQHVDHENLRARPADARDFGECARGLRRIVQHQRQQRRIELAIFEGQRLELAAPDVDVAKVCEPLPSGVEHLRRSINGDHAADIGRHRFGELTRAASNITNRQRRIDQTQYGP